MYKLQARGDAPGTCKSLILSTVGARQPTARRVPRPLINYAVSFCRLGIVKSLSRYDFANMSVLTCKLPAALDERLAELVRRRGVAKSVIVRKAIANTIAAQAASGTRPPQTLLEALGGGIGCVASGKGDLARNKRQAIPLIGP